MAEENKDPDEAVVTLVPEAEDDVVLYESPPLTGGSSSYYIVGVQYPTTPDTEPYYAECNDIIESLGMTFAEGNVFKAIWRRAADRQGNGKLHTTSKYDAEKIVFFANRILTLEGG